MKKIVLKIIIVALTLGSGTVALAQGYVPQNVKEKNATSTEKRAIVQNIIKNRFSKMLDRYEATIDREKTIMARLNSRIAKIKASGANTLAAEKLMTDAKTQLDKSVNSLEALRVAINNELIQENASTTSQLTKDAVTSMRKAGKDIENALREAHKAMQKTIGVLKGVSELHNASSTKENSN